jgi:hypothetical protein
MVGEFSSEIRYHVGKLKRGSYYIIPKPTLNSKDIHPKLIKQIDRNGRIETQWLGKDADVQDIDVYLN